MKSLKISILVFASMVAACFMGTGKVQAQEFTIQGDLVSSYVWRGFYQTGASFQPTLGFGVGDFSLTAWGSTDFDGVSSGEGAAACGGADKEQESILILRVTKQLITLKRD